ncbi:MAG TPA: hypothetical protein VFG66_08895 [Gemmatimonadales bacterium]|nr:hypothetical protein [Gemmatimonadales bacterium]
MSGPADYLLVRGRVELSKQVRVDPAGDLTNEFHGAPVGEPYEAEVKDHQVTRFGDDGGQVDGQAMQMELPHDVAGRGKKIVRHKVGPGGVTLFDRDITCK